MSAGVDVCALCAWRAACQKKFSISGRDIHCPDFVRDVMIKKEPEEEKKKEEGKRE